MNHKDLTFFGRQNRCFILKLGLAMGHLSFTRVHVIIVDIFYCARTYIFIIDLDEQSKTYDR